MTRADERLVVAGIKPSGGDGRRTAGTSVLSGRC